MWSPAFNERFLSHRRVRDLAWRMLSHHARPHTVTQWTKLSERRIRTLLENYGPRGIELARPRGRAPYKIDVFLASPQNRREAGLFLQLGLPAGILGGKLASQPFFSIERGEVICGAFEHLETLHPLIEMRLESALLISETLFCLERYTCLRCPNCRQINMIEIPTGEPRCIDCGIDLPRQPFL
jgi:hypothetical protein